MQVVFSKVLLFDETFYGNGASNVVYSSAALEGLLSGLDDLSVHVVVQELGGAGGNLTVDIESSPDGLTWASAVGLISASAFPTRVATSIIGGKTLSHVGRARLAVQASAGVVRVKIWGTGRVNNNGLGCGCGGECGGPAPDPSRRAGARNATDPGGASPKAAPLGDAGKRRDPVFKPLDQHWPSQTVPWDPPPHYWCIFDYAECVYTKGYGSPWGERICKYLYCDCMELEYPCTVASSGFDGNDSGGGSGAGDCGAPPCSTTNCALPIQASQCCYTAGQSCTLCKCCVTKLYKARIDQCNECNKNDAAAQQACIDYVNSSPYPDCYKKGAPCNP